MPTHHATERISEPDQNEESSRTKRCRTKKWMPVSTTAVQQCFCPSFFCPLLTPDSDPFDRATSVTARGPWPKRSSVGKPSQSFQRRNRPRINYARSCEWVTASTSSTTRQLNPDPPLIQERPAASHPAGSKKERRRWDSNPRIMDLQSIALAAWPRRLLLILRNLEKDC